MGILRRVRDYERTCEECGTAWRVPKAIARPRVRLAHGVTNPGVGQGVAIGPLSTSQPSAVRDRMMGEQYGRNLNSAAGRTGRATEDLGRCPRCGSEEYSQRPFRP